MVIVQFTLSTTGEDGDDIPVEVTRDNYMGMIERWGVHTIVSALLDECDDLQRKVKHLLS